MSTNTAVVEMLKYYGEHCVSLYKGNDLFNKIIKMLEENSNIVLDFKNVLTITSSFLNASIAKLYGQFEEAYFLNKIKYLNLDETDTQLLNLVIKNAKEHFSKSPDVRKLENKIVEDTINKKLDE